MNHDERFQAVMGFQPVDRLPRWEWAMWWDKTIDRWHGEGLPKDLHFSQVFDTAELNERNILLIIDTDGDVTRLVPWLQSVGAAGVLPLERQAGVDGMKLREEFPGLLMVGHFNKRVMGLGEAAIRAEFERLVPVMRFGGFIPSVDHQTPPDVSMEQYRTYLRCLDEYSQLP